jgi:hypothetical protein
VTKGADALRAAPDPTTAAPKAPKATPEETVTAGKRAAAHKSAA